MISLIWMLWLFHQMIILVVLLNFLIAIISQSYENVMSKSMIFKYRQRVQLNLECLLILDTFGVLKPFNCMTIVSEDSNFAEDSGEW